MRRGPTWIQLFVALTLIALLAVVSPAVGGPSLRSLVKREVAKQLAADGVAVNAKAKKGPRGPAGRAGPTGAAGAAGAVGAAGADGSARAYANVFAGCTGTPPAESCPFQSNSKGVSSVTRISTGVYCIVAPGITPGTSAAVANVDWSNTNNPEGIASAMIADPPIGPGCPADQFAVVTERLIAATNADVSNTVGFTILIP